MIVSDRQGGSLGRPGSRGASNQSSTELESLFLAAQAEGGALADAASRLSDPKQSFFATLTDKTFATFSAFANAIQTPSYTVAGLFDPNSTVKQAIQERITPGDLILGDVDRDAGFGERLGYGIGKFAIDTITDPLTYLTFGASRGVVGLTKGAEIMGGTRLAAQLGKSQAGREFLSERGEELANNYLQAKRNGLRQTYLRNQRKRMVDEGLDEADIVERLKVLEDTTSDFEIQNILNADLDMDYATKAVARLLENKPHLAETLIDKGGIKFMGRSILSSQRIRATKAMVPGMSAMDRAMSGIRGYMGNMFSTNYAKGQRLPDELIDQEQKYRNLYESQRDRLMKDGVRLKQELNLSNEEWEFITAAIEHGVRPYDKKGEDVWRLLRGENPQNGTIPENVWRGMIEVQRLNKGMRKSLIDSGIPVPNRVNYMPHMLVKEKIKNIPFKPAGLRQTTNRTKFAKVSALVDDAGRRIPVQFADRPGEAGTKVSARVAREDGVTDEVLEVADDGSLFDRDYTKYQRVVARVDEAKQLGVDFEENALVASLLAADEAIQVSTGRHFIKEVGEKFGVKESQAPEGYVKVSKTGLKSENIDLAKWLLAEEGEELMFHPSVAKKIETFTQGMSGDEGIDSFLSAYDSLQNYFKAAVTSIFPAFHGRNALSNVFLMFNKIGVEALNPANHVAAANLLTLQQKTASLQRKLVKGTASAEDYAALMTKQVYRDKNGYDWTWGELRSQLIDNVVAFHHTNMGITDQLKFGKNEVAEFAKKMFPDTKTGKIKEKYGKVNPLSRDNMLFQGGFKVGQTIEDYSRTLTFLAQLKGTGDPMQAARVTKQALFDYSNLTRFEKEFMRRLVPFYSFTRKNLELQVNTLLTNPGKIAQQIRLTTTMGDAFGGEQLSDEELEALPDWAKRGLNMVRDREGSHVTLLRTIGSPVEEVLSRGDAQANLGIVSPLVKAPLEWAMDYSFFHGKPISQVTNADAYKFAPDSVKDFIGFDEVRYTDRDGNEQVYYTSYNPERMWMLNNIQPTGRMMSEINRITKAREGGTARTLNTLFFGFSEREFDIEQEKERRRKENQKRLEELLQQGGVGYTFSRYVPE